jgi:hypothetical protein
MTDQREARRSLAVMPPLIVLLLGMPTLKSARPLYPYPMAARFAGKGDPNDPANYAPARSPVGLPQAFGADIMSLIAPDNQKNYVVREGRLVALDH